MVGLGANLLGIDSSSAIFIGVLHSRSVANSLVNRFDLKKVYGSGRERMHGQTSPPVPISSKTAKAASSPLRSKTRDPQRAAAIATAYIDELNHLLAEVNTSSAHRERVFIEERLKVVKAALDDASKQLSDFSTKNVTLDPKEQGKAMVGAAVALQGELIAAETQLHGLEPIYSDSNIRLQSLRAFIAELHHQLAQIRGSDPAQVSATAPSGNDSYPSFRRTPFPGADLRRSLERTEDEKSSSKPSPRIRGGQDRRAKEIPSVKVLDPANLPEKKSGPHGAVIGLLGLIVSVALVRSSWSEIGLDASRPGRSSRGAHH